METLRSVGWRGGAGAGKAAATGALGRAKTEVGARIEVGTRAKERRELVGGCRFLRHKGG